MARAHDFEREVPERFHKYGSFWLDGYDGPPWDWKRKHPLLEPEVRVVKLRLIKPRTAP